MKKLFSFFVLLSVVGVLFAQEYKQKTLYKGGVYGQTFEITEYSDGNRCKIELFMSDNKNKNTQVQTFDSTYPTVYFIQSKWFSNPSEYSNAVDASKEFLDVSMNLIYLADMKDICDIAPCCKSLDYSFAQGKNGKKYIRLEYECSDLEKLFEIASMYNAKGREYVLERYLK